MRFNLTLDDDLGDLLELEAAKVSGGAVRVSANDLIREAVIDKFGVPAVLRADKFTVLQPKKFMAYLLESNGRYFIANGDFRREGFGDHVIKGIIEIKKELVGLFVDPKHRLNERFLWGQDPKGTFTGLRVSPSEFLVCFLTGFIDSDSATEQTLNYSGNRKEYMVDSKLLAFLFIL